MVVSKVLGLAALVLTVSAPLAQAAATAPAPTRTVRIDLGKMTPAELETFARTSFTRLDKDSDGFITTAESPTMSRVSTQNGEVKGGESSQQLWVEKNDADRDGKVSWDEYFDRMKAMAASQR